MAWIESHDTLARHPKTRRLARTLNISLPQAIGHLHLLWWWALEYTQDGDLSRFSAEDVADGALWEQAPDVFLAALQTAGFVDSPDAGPGRIHDWDDYAGRILAQRAGNAARQQAWKARHKENTPSPALANAAVTTGDISPNSYVTVTYPSANTTTVPDRTVPDLTIPLDDPPLPPAAVPPEPTAANAAEQESQTRQATQQEPPPTDRPPRERRGVKPTPHQQAAFDKIWVKYPARNGSRGVKADALATFVLIAEADWPDLAQALDNYAAICTAPGGRLPKDASRFLAAKFWPDYVDVQLDPPPKGSPDAYPPKRTYAEREHAAAATAVSLVQRLRSGDSAAGSTRGYGGTADPDPPNRALAIAG